MPAEKEGLPSTLERSPKKVQRTSEKALDSERSQMNEDEVVEALRKLSDPETAKAGS